LLEDALEMARRQAGLGGQAVEIGRRLPVARQPLDGGGHQPSGFLVVIGLGHDIRL
jgi:hypothetical protein